MSQDQLNQFQARVAQDPALTEELTFNVTTAQEFADRAIAKAKALGYEITGDDANKWLQEQKHLAESGELSDTQLEAVAGGKRHKNMAAILLGDPAEHQKKIFG